MFFLLVTLVVLLSFSRAQQNPWPYPFQQQIPPPLQHQGFPLNGFVPLGSNGLQQFEGFPFGNRPIYNGAPPQQQPQPDIPPPRMQLLRIQLLCESAAQQSPSIRWIRRDSAAVSSTAITIAEGAKPVDPNKYAVNLENLPNGIIRSVLTILRPEPDSSQAAYYCQAVISTSSSVESREVYVIGNRQFVNANMAYHAADTFTGFRQRSGPTPAMEAVHLVTPHSHYLNESGMLIYHEHDHEKRATHNLSLPSTMEYSSTLDKP